MAESARHGEPWAVALVLCPWQFGLWRYRILEGNLEVDHCPCWHSGSFPEPCEHHHDMVQLVAAREAIRELVEVPGARP